MLWDRGAFWRVYTLHSDTLSSFHFCWLTSKTRNLLSTGKRRPETWIGQTFREESLFRLKLEKRKREMDPRDTVRTQWHFSWVKTTSKHPRKQWQVLLDSCNVTISYIPWERPTQQRLDLWVGTTHGHLPRPGTMLFLQGQFRTVPLI